MEDLYAIDAAGLELQKACGGNLQGSNETCVAFAALPGTEDAYVIADSKLGTASPKLRFTGNELRALMDQLPEDPADKA